MNHPNGVHSANCHDFNTGCSYVREIPCPSRACGHAASRRLTRGTTKGVDMTDPGRSVRRPSRIVLGSLAAAAALLAAGLPQSAPAAAAPSTSAVTAAAADGGAPTDDVSTLSAGWQTPWEIKFMPDGRSALVTERLTYQVYRLDRDGSRTLVGEVPNTVPEPYDDGPGGLLGVAPSPTWNGTTDKQVFFVHTT